MHRDGFLRLRPNQMRAKAAPAHPPNVVGSGVESKVMPAMSRLPLASPLVDASPDTVNTVPPVAPLTVKKSASTFPNTALAPVAVPPRAVRDACLCPLTATIVEEQSNDETLGYTAIHRESEKAGER